LLLKRNHDRLGLFDIKAYLYIKLASIEISE